MMIFTKRISTAGQLFASFVFKSQAEVNRWLAKDLPLLEAQYGALTLHHGDLPGLSVGDKCNVWGEADDVFVITGITQYSKDNWGFLLNNGCTEGVSKCHTEYL